MRNLLLIFIVLSSCAYKNISGTPSKEYIIHFENASAEIRAEYVPLLYTLADSLTSNPEIQILVRGHVCCIPRNRLAKIRAKTVRNYLMRFGVAENRLSVVGMKNKEPLIYPEESHDDELMNMRVDFIFYEENE